MQTAKRRQQTTWAVTASVLAHLAVGLFLLSQKSTLPRPPDFAGPPEAIIPLLILPRTPPVPASGETARPAPIRLHRRPQRFLPPDVPTAPIAPPEPPAPAAAPAPAPRGPVALHPSPLPEGPKGDVRAALRAGTVGCANPVVTGLNKAEREHCDEVFGKGAKDTAFAGLGLNADKQRLLDAAAARKEGDYSYKHSTPVAGEKATGPLGGIGSSAHDLGKSLGNDRPEVKVPY